MTEQEWYAAFYRCARCFDFRACYAIFRFGEAEWRRQAGESPWSAAAEMWPYATKRVRVLTGA